jgi:divalent metal cation (Fe/Co/Zn/Cd) transporter
MWVNLVVLTAAFAFNGVSLLIALREMRRYQRAKKYQGGIFAVVRQSHNPAMWVTVLADLAAVAGILVAAVGVALSALLDSSVPDAAASIVDGALMMAVGVLLGAEARGLVTGEGARASLLDDARRILAEDEHLVAVTKLRSLQLGPEDVLLVVTARFADDVRARDLPRIRSSIEARLQRAHPSIREIVFAF